VAPAESELEQALARFKLKAPSAETRRRVLAAGHEVWKRSRGRRLAFPAFGYWLLGYAAAAAILLLLGGVCVDWDSRQTAELLAPPATVPPLDPEVRQLYAEMGLNPAFVQNLAQMRPRIKITEIPAEWWKQRQETIRALAGC
jgi:hypothetical protein